MWFMIRSYKKHCALQKGFLQAFPALVTA